MSQVRKVFFFIGRALFSSLFLISGIKNLVHWHASLESLAMKLCEWNLHFNGAFFFEKLIHFAPLLLILSTTLLIVGGLTLLLGYLFRTGTFLLLLFLIPTTILFHDFWFQVGNQYEIELIMFSKNLALIGSLLLFTLGYPFKKQEHD